MSAAVKLVEHLLDKATHISLLKITTITDNASVKEYSVLTPYMQMLIYDASEAGVLGLSLYFDSTLPVASTIFATERRASEPALYRLCSDKIRGNLQSYSCMQESPQANAPPPTWLRLPVVIISKEANKFHGFFPQSTGLQN